MKRFFFASAIFASIGLGVWWLSTSDIDNTEPQEVEAGPSDRFTNKRIFPYGEIDLEAVQQARLQIQNMRMRPGSGFVANWVQRGPFNIQGRITGLAVDPRDDDVAYAGAADGGIFRTFNGGDTWTPVFDDQTTLSMGAVALDPSNPDVVYAGTGEANSSGDSYMGNGLYRSTDQGDSWTFIGLENSGHIGRVVVHPSNPDIIHVAVMGHMYTEGPDRGVYRTDDGGLTWTRTLHLGPTVGCIDIIQRPDNPDILFAAMWERIRGPELRVFGGPLCGVHRSDDGGLTWTLVENGLPPSSADNGRIGLALCASQPDVMCAIYADSSGPFLGLYRTTDGGTTWTQTNDGSLANMYATYGWWFGNVRIHPQNPDIIYPVGFHDYLSTDGGNSYAEVGSDVMHVDHHALAFGSGPTPKIYAGNDGGVYTSTNGTLFTKTTGDLPITQAYRVNAASWNTDAVWLGTQDNGTLADLDGDGDYVRIFGGDGFEPLPHLLDSSRIWVQYQWGNVRYSSNGGNSFSNATNGLSGRRNWDAPHAQDPNDPETRYFGSHVLFRNSGNTSWTAISGDLTGGSHPSGGLVRGSLTSIGVSPADSQVIWTGSDDGFVYVTTDGGSTWVNVSEGLPERWITSVHPHPFPSSKALVSVSGYRWGEVVAHVYATDDFGQTWTPADGNLPDIPVNDVFIDPKNTKRYFAATDIGVFQTLDEGQSWDIFGQGLPSVVVSDLAYLADTRELFAGTHGRSILSIAIPEINPDSMNITSGILADGSVVELACSDNVDLSVRRGNTVQSSVVLELKGVSHLENPPILAFMLEGSVFSRGDVTQTVSLFNYDSDSFEPVDVRTASRFLDQRIEIRPTGDSTRFVQPGTGCVEARIQFDGSTPRMKFTANIDQANWFVSE